MGNEQMPLPVFKDGIPTPRCCAVVEVTVLKRIGRLDRQHLHGASEARSDRRLLASCHSVLGKPSGNRLVQTYVAFDAAAPRRVTNALPSHAIAVEGAVGKTPARGSKLHQRRKNDELEPIFMHRKWVCDGV